MKFKVGAFEVEIKDQRIAIASTIQDIDINMAIVLPVQKTDKFWIGLNVDKLHIEVSV